MNQPELQFSDVPAMPNPHLYTMNTQAESFEAVHNEGTAKTQRDRMIALYRKYGSLSDEEMKQHLNIPKSTISARRDEIAFVVEDVDNYHRYSMLSGGKPIKRTAKRWKIKSG